MSTVHIQHLSGRFAWIVSSSVCGHWKFGHYFDLMMSKRFFPHFQNRHLSRTEQNTCCIHRIRKSFSEIIEFPLNYVKSFSICFGLKGGGKCGGICWQLTIRCVRCSHVRISIIPSGLLIVPTEQKVEEKETKETRTKLSYYVRQCLRAIHNIMCKYE